MTTYSFVLIFIQFAKCEWMKELTNYILQDATEMSACLKAVVDNKLKVYRIKNLRDASIIPKIIITGHTNAPSIMIGEKAA